ncbi:hypothetical protein JMJ77_0001008 [Colletotrichum scovillei]|uniref:Uncharacterized protein n=1 Tax=Colletotrichum scovillei TaxID=1209932 RepID=A0A9P7UHW0_9PEZI|nr:hypothetical protein JMJ77_0001008 [Colletotrichum scovillei]KAG7072228.1 hypothetical protein JMJ76_0005084 [Colletotrichum scovillei]KAG7080469.1 hypothetical protein JMJ78_0007563 [Colletotrichum scovillei]
MKRSLRIADVYVRPTYTNMGHDTLRQSTANDYGLQRIQNCANEIRGARVRKPPSLPSKKRCRVVSKRRIYDSSTRNAASYPI